MRSTRAGSEVTLDAVSQPYDRGRRQEGAEWPNRFACRYKTIRPDDRCGLGTLIGFPALIWEHAWITPTGVPSETF